MARGEEFQSIAPFLDDREAANYGETLGIGSAVLIGPTEVEVLSYQTLTVEYTVGDTGIDPGGGIRVAMRHVHRWTDPQTGDPKADGYLTVSTVEGASPTLIAGDQGLFKRYHPWQHLVEVKINERGLKPGEKIRVTYGDASGGSRGIRVQPFDETHFVFKVYVDPRGEDAFYPLKKNPTLRVVASAPYRLGMVAPSDAVVGEPTWFILRAEDRYGNPATDYLGTVELEVGDPEAQLPDSYTFTEEDQGVHRFDNVVFQTVGAFNVHVTDGTFEAESNPIQVQPSRPEELLLWGDLHGHTLFSDGRGTVEEFYTFARDISGLDFCAVTDHAFEIVDWMWEESKKVTNSFNEPGRFVTFPAYEWSGVTDVGGDHNVFFLEDDPPLYRSRSYYDYMNLQMYHGSDPMVNHIEDLFITLACLQENENIFCIPHYGGRKANPAFHNPKIQRMVEIFSEHRRSHDWASGFLMNGQRLGIIASTDGHFGNPGYGYLKPVEDWDNQEIGMAAVAVYAEERTRESVFHALYNRRVYATSGDRIILDFNADDHPMGSEFASKTPPELHVKVIGTSPILRVHFRKNSLVAHTVETSGREVDLKWTDPEFNPEKETYYYVQVEQENGEEAYSSPVWVN
ncbi:MAG: DUF3604 domain-containing protein [Candidatus Omnitrophica bacterium]|nr:DUF3604 domain-containing protein [Candidatus Omnitrophota bacterium]